MANMNQIVLIAAATANQLLLFVTYIPHCLDIVTLSCRPDAAFTVPANCPEFSSLPEKEWPSL